MNTETARIPLQRKIVPHSYNLQRRLQNRSGPTIRSTKNERHLVTDSNRLAMTGYAGAIYYADVYLGASAYNLIVDTGSTDTWVSCYVYDETRCLSTCPAAALKITYGSGTVCVSTEILPVKLGNLTIRDYGVGVALNPIVRPGTESSGGILLGQSQGILGLGYPALATITSVPGYFVKFLKSFSVYIAPDDSANGSFLLLDGVDDVLIKQNGLVPFSLPLKQATHWTVGLMDFRVVGSRDTVVPCSPTDGGSCNAIIDTGTTMIVIPRRVYNFLISNVFVPAGCRESQLAESRGMYVCNSSAKLPRLAFTFGETNFYLDMEDYIQRTGHLFYVEIQGSSGSLQGLEESWVLGGTFLKKFYSSYEVSKAVVLYCNDGDSCDQNGTASSLPGDTVLARTPSANGSQASVTPSDNSTGSIVNVPKNATSNNSTGGTIVSTTSSGGKSHTTTIAIIASIAGVALIIAIIFVVRKLTRKRQAQKSSLQGIEMETLAASDTAYASGVVLTPTTTAETS